MISILEVGKPRLREAKSLALGNVANLSKPQLPTL